MNRFAKVGLLAAATVIAVIVLANAATGWLYSSAGCSNAEQQRVPSADGRHDLVVFERDCGATTDISTQVSVVEHGAKLADSPGNAYISEHQANVAVTWKADTLAAITYSGGRSGSQENRRVGGISITYSEGPSSHAP
jgi:hypothetical protein